MQIPVGCTVVSKQHVAVLTSEAEGWKMTWQSNLSDLQGERFGPSQKASMHCASEENCFPRETGTEVEELIIWKEKKYADRHISLNEKSHFFGWLLYNPTELVCVPVMLLLNRNLIKTINTIKWTFKQGTTVAKAVDYITGLHLCMCMSSQSHTYLHMIQLWNSCFTLIYILLHSKDNVHTAVHQNICYFSGMLLFAN